MNSSTQPFSIIDCQVHCYERDHPERPWIGWLHGPPEVTGDDMVAAMDTVGVAGALLISPWSMYRFDASYALEVYAKHASRFGIIKPFDPTSPSVADEVTQWAATPGVVGARIMLANLGSPAADDPGINAVLRAGARCGLPINILCAGHLPLIVDLAAQNPDTQIIVDHLGLKQPFEPPAPDEPFADLPNVLALAEQPNVAIKISGACTLSKSGYPYEDIWPALEQIFAAFGLERCLWGTDWTRAVELLSYEQGVRPFADSNRLSDSDKAALMGGSLRRIYGWQPG